MPRKCKDELLSQGFPYLTPVINMIFSSIRPFVSVVSFPLLLHNPTKFKRKLSWPASMINNLQTQIHTSFPSSCFSVLHYVSLPISPNRNHIIKHTNISLRDRPFDFCGEGWRNLRGREIWGDNNIVLSSRPEENVFNSQTGGKILFP